MRLYPLRPFFVCSMRFVVVVILGSRWLQTVFFFLLLMGPYTGSAIECYNKQTSQQQKNFIFRAVVVFCVLLSKPSLHFKFDVFHAIFQLSVVLTINLLYHLMLPQQRHIEEESKNWISCTGTHWISVRLYIPFSLTKLFFLYCFGRDVNRVCRMNKHGHHSHTTN